MAAVTRRSYAGAAPACTLTNSITAGDTSALLTGTVTAWNNTANGPFYMVIDPGLATEEKVLVGSRTGSSLSRLPVVLMALLPLRILLVLLVTQFLLLLTLMRLTVLLR